MEMDKLYCFIFSQLDSTFLYEQNGNVLFAKFVKYNANANR